MDVDLTQLDDTDCHYWLTQAMARTADVSLRAEMASGRISEADFVGMVARCGACQTADDCVRWMAQGAPGSGAQLPGYCLNHEIIEALRDT
ncbi:MAG: DUF6455 family protein [Pseudomonadota bacterium]